jgi:hypothetical protein
LSSLKTFRHTLQLAENRIESIICSKLESFFELAEYEWLPSRPQSTAAEPSTYVFEMITFLTAYVDSVLIGLNEEIKTRAYASALDRIRQWIMVCAITTMTLTCRKRYAEKVSRKSTKRHYQMFSPTSALSRPKSSDLSGLR